MLCPSYHYVLVDARALIQSTELYFLVFRCVGSVAGFSQPTLLGINVGLTIEPLAPATLTSTQALCSVLTG